MYNTSIVGWRGHMENGSTHGTVQGFHHFLKSLIHKVIFFSDILSKVAYDWKKVLRKVAVKTIHKELLIVKGTDVKWLPTPLYPGGCQLIDLLDYFNLTGNNVPMQIYFYLEKTEALGAQIFIEERNKALSKRTLASSMLSYNGPDIRNLDLSVKRFFKVILRISQNIFVERDERKKCRNYPNANFDSYKDCDEHFLYREMKNKYNVIPFWTAYDLNEVTSKRYENLIYINAIH